MIATCEWCAPLRKRFYRFPSGWTGVTLLLLRLLVGGLAIVEASLIYFHVGSALPLAGTGSVLPLLAAGCAAFLGLSLWFGFMTPLVGGLLALEAATLLLAQAPVGLTLLDSRMAVFEYSILAAVLAVLGPGAISIDARLFGLREVAISERRLDI